MNGTKTQKNRSFSRKKAIAINGTIGNVTQAAIEPNIHAQYKSSEIGSGEKPLTTSGIAISGNATSSEAISETCCDPKL